MTRNNLWNTLRKALTAAAMTLIVCLMLASGASASRYQILHEFRTAKYGAGPSGNLIMDVAGNLYGTTGVGGDLSCNAPYGCGVVFKLTHTPSGWSESVLYAFTGGEGAGPNGLIFDSAGNLYGTSGGGAYNQGAVFKLTPNPDGTWAESTLYSFTGGADGRGPTGGVVVDAAGNLYGMTPYGGQLSCNGGFGCGVVFKLTLAADGSWTESVIHAFGGPDGTTPYTSRLTFDTAGNLYGTTLYGGNYSGCIGEGSGCGTVFQLKPNSDGSWTETVIHAFNGRDGRQPQAGVIFGAGGSLYGVTALGTNNNHGVVFKLTPNPDGTWTNRVLHSFTGADGSYPWAELASDAAGNLYGTTLSGGSPNCTLGCGVVFELSLTSGRWSETVLHAFSGYGKQPRSSMIVDAAGNLYGTVTSGSVNHGFVFEILKKCPD